MPGIPDLTKDHNRTAAGPVTYAISPANYIICDDPDVVNDGYGDWDGNTTWITSIKG